LGRETDYFYDLMSNVMEEKILVSTVQATDVRPSVLDAQGNTQTEVTTDYTYNLKFSKMTTKIDAENHKTVYDIDSNTGNLMSVADQLNETTSYTYDDFGDLLTVTDPNKNVTTYSDYDRFGNPWTITGPGDIITHQQFDVRGRLVEKYDNFGHHVVYAYDGLDRMIYQDSSGQGQGSDEHITEYQYDAAGNLVQTIVSNLDSASGEQVTENHYDAQNRRISTTEVGIPASDRPDGQYETDWFYDAVGNLDHEIDARDIEQDYSYDSLNRRTKTMIANSPTGVGKDGVIFEADYDLANNQTFTKDIHGNETDYTYDGLYRVVDVQLPFDNNFGTLMPSSGYNPSFPGLPATSSGVTTGSVHVQTGYDRVGNKLFEADANGNATLYTYDAVNRLKTTTDPEGNQVSYDYDNNGNIHTETHTAPTGATTYLITFDAYDERNRPTAKHETLYAAFAGDSLAPLPETASDPSSSAFGQLTTSWQYDDPSNTVTITDPRNNQTTEVRDGLDQLISRTVKGNGLSSPLTTTYAYDGAGNVKYVIDPQNNDHDVTYLYDGLGRKVLATYVDPGSNPAETNHSTSAGTAEVFGYDGDGNLIHYVDKNGNDFTYTFDSLNRPLDTVLQERGGGPPLSHLFYDDAHNEVQETDANQNAPTIKDYDALGRLTHVEDPLNGKMDMLYDGVNLRQQTDRNGNLTVYTYDRLNRLRQTDESGPVGDPTQMQNIYRDDLLQVISVDRRGIQTIQSSDSRGRLVRLSRADATSPTYAGDSSLAARYGASKIDLEQYEYDGNNNKVVFIQAPDSSSETRTEYGYDAANRQTTMIEGVGSSVEATTTYTYDNAGNLLTVSNPRTGGLFMKYGYDARYRRISETNGENETTQYAYDANGNMTDRVEPKGGHTVYTYDEQNRLLEVDEGQSGGGQTFYVYDRNGNKIAQQDAEKHLVTYHYDALNRLTDTFEHTVLGSILGPTYHGSYGSFGGDESTALHWQYEYDANGNQIRITDAIRANGLQGQITEGPNGGGIVFDHLNRPTDVVYNNAVNANLPFQMQEIQYSYDGNGNLKEVDETKLDRNGKVIIEPCTYVFDAMDRLQSTTNYDDKTIEYTYDRQGNRTSITDPDQLTTTYEYDARNRLMTVTAEPVSPSGNQVTHYEYYPDSLIKKITYPNGTVADYQEYDDANRLKTLVNSIHVGGPGEQVVSSYEYEYDENGNRTVQIETQRDINGGQPEITDYRYDMLDRLTDVYYDVAVAGVDPQVGRQGELHYTHELNSNRKTEKGKDPLNSMAPVDRTYFYDGANRLDHIIDAVNPLESRLYQYDDNGNRTAEKIGQFTSATTFMVHSATYYDYGVRDELLQVRQSGSPNVNFDYNADLLRVKKIDGLGTAESSETRYLYDDTATLLEYDAQGNTLRKYNYGYDFLSMTEVNPAAADPRANQFYLVDGLGSTVNLTNEAGDLQISYQYDAWGNLRAQVGTSSNPKDYTGNDFDPETDLQYFGARYYDSSVGLFISQDQYLGQASSPPSLHRYLYANANPLRYVDFTGHEAEDTSNSEVDLSHGPTVEAAAQLERQQAMAKRSPSVQSISPVGTSDTTPERTTIVEDKMTPGESMFVRPEDVQAKEEAEFLQAYQEARQNKYRAITETADSKVPNVGLVLRDGQLALEQKNTPPVEMYDFSEEPSEVTSQFSLLPPEEADQLRAAVRLGGQLLHRPTSEDEALWQNYVFWQTAAQTEFDALQFVALDALPLGPVKK
jgi:RHS repeat-associated protein